MFVLFKNADVDGLRIDVASKVDDILGVSFFNGETVISIKGAAKIMVRSPIETVVGLINQALGQTAVPDQPEKSVVIIEGK